jgi:5,6-dimethylbenzimidazole synthase
VTEHAFTATERRAVYRAIAERRDMRRFVPHASVPDDVLARLLHAAHSAPSVGLMQPWRFIRITDAVLRTRIHGLSTRNGCAPRRHWAPEVTSSWR